MLKLLHSNSSCRSVSNKNRVKCREAKHIQNQPRKGKNAKFGDIGMSLLNNKRKKSLLNSSKHQNSEYVEMNNMSSLQNKGKFIYSPTVLNFYFRERIVKREY